MRSSARGPLAFCAAALAVIAAAQEAGAPAAEAGDFAGARIGYSRAREADGGGLIAGAVLRHTIVAGVATELAAQYRAEDTFDTDLSLRVIPVTLSMSLDLVPSIHMTGGIGWYVSRFDWKPPGTEDHTENELGFHYGVGFLLERPSGPQFAADLRYHAVGEEEFDDATGDRDDVSLDFWAAQVSILFRLR